MEQDLSTSLETPGDLQVKCTQQQKGPSRHHIVAALELMLIKDIQSCISY